MMSLDSSPPKNVLFLLTSMPVGGAETLLVNMIRCFDRNRINPLVACLKDRDVMGKEIDQEIPVFDHLIKHKFDVGVVFRLRRIMAQHKIDAVVTIGAGDKMFWGRIAAFTAGVPVILSALHSTGWPDGVGRLNRMLTPITDGFIAVAKQHADYQVHQERFPANKVFLIPNGIDTQKFRFDPHRRQFWRSRLRISADAPVVSIVAALRPEKNHKLFLNAAKLIQQHLPQAHFLIAGDGPLRPELELQSRELNIQGQVHFLGSTNDVVGILSAADMFALTSDNEASPVSIMEALSCQRPVVAPQVGSIDETVVQGQTGFLFPPGDAEQAAQNWLNILSNPTLAAQLGDAGRALVVQQCSLQSMTEGYTHLIESCHASKTGRYQVNDISMQSRPCG